MIQPGINPQNHFSQPEPLHAYETLVEQPDIDTLYRRGMHGGPNNLYSCNFPHPRFPHVTRTKMIQNDLAKRRRQDTLRDKGASCM